MGPDCDADKGCRPGYELDGWVKKCPVKRLRNYLLKKKMITQSKIDKIREGIEKEITIAETFAKQSPFPDVETLAKDVYSKDIICPGQK